jgi:ATP-dependent exoDNAse (exonuclease V) beta subunit
MPEIDPEIESGLASSSDSAEITEFLVAPLQPKGADRGKAKEWVDQVYRQRESQEDRRILYVAATRAREELHFFARPAYKTEMNLSRTLVEPKGSLLAIAWPALEEEISKRFVEWRQATSQRELEGGVREGITLDSLAASGESNLLQMPSPTKPTLLRRLPPDYRPTQSEASSQAAPESAVLGTGPVRLYARHEGGLLSRALGSAVHALLEELSRLRATNDWTAARAALQQFEPRIAAQVRAAGIEQSKAAGIAAQALQLALNASRSPQAQWILSPHPGAASEVRWAGVVAGSLRTVRVDRVFRAGFDPMSEGQNAWWIVDYKTAHADNLDPATEMPKLHSLFAPQIEAYAQVLRNLRGQDAVIRAGLYYPRMVLLDWWEL